MSLSIDHTTTYDCNCFHSMRALHTCNLHRFGPKNKVTMRQLLRLATIDGARDLGFGDKTGSLTPGKRADLILVRATDMNLAPVKDPYHAMVFHGQPSNVDTVMVDGRILVRRSAHTSIDVPKLLAEAAGSAQGIEERSRRG
jgi:5-methylthioadenosine/S-adenosylhomocysteine deaminase